MSRHSLTAQFPLRLMIGGIDYSFLLADQFTFSNTDPGGYEMASFTLPRDLPGVIRGMPVRLDCGTAVAWLGRVKEIQRSLGAKTLVQCEGYGAALKDETVAEIFVDRDLTKWQAATALEQVGLLEAGYTPGSVTVAPAEVGNLPAVVATLTGPWVAGGLPISDGWYNAQGIPLGAVHYEAITGHNVNFSEANWDWFVGLYETSVGGGGTNTGNLRGAGPTAGYLDAGSANQTWALLRLQYNAAGGASNTAYTVAWEKLAVYGRAFEEFVIASGWEGRGTAPAGYYTSEIVSFIASLAAGIEAGVIPQATQYIVPHSVYLNPVELQQVVADMAKLVGYHWGVWESLEYLTGNNGARLDFRPYPAAGEPTAYAWRSDCEILDVREDLSAQYNTAKVAYTEAAGTQGVVTARVPNPVLEAANIPTRTIALSLGTSTQPAAEAYGKLALEVLQLQARVLGNATIKQPIKRVGGGVMAPWMLKAGIDRLRIPDLPSFDVWGAYNDLPISRVECSGSATGYTTSVEFGLGKNLMETLTAQLQQAAILGGQGG